jgi:glycosyltransferase involved in cell wall biosynthesis
MLPDDPERASAWALKVGRKVSAPSVDARASLTQCRRGLASKQDMESVLTVVLPNYNHSRFLPYALEGLLAQTRPADELIIIDDASTDHSLEVIETFLPRFANAILIRNKENVGVVRNMNSGMHIATGSLLTFCAADDIVYPTFFERTVELLRSFPQAAFASAMTEIIDENGIQGGKVKLPVPLDCAGYIDPQAAARLLMHDDAWFTGNATVFRRDSLIAVGGFPEALESLTDGYVSRVLAVQYGVCFLPEILTAWRRMESGFGLACSVDISNATHLAERAVKAMRESGATFFPGYPERWKRRFLFGIQRFALVNTRQKAWAMGPGPFALAFLREVVKTPWLFAWLRPQDALAVFRRQLKK